MKLPQLDLLQICVACADPERQCAGECVCPSDLISIIEHASVGSCPLGKFRAGASNGRRHVGPEPEYRCRVRNRRLWLQLHLRASRYRGDAVREVAAIYRIGVRICGAPCVCFAEFADYLSQHPPRLRDRHSLALWGWELHESVNLRRGVTGVPFALACARYGWPTAA